MSFKERFFNAFASVAFYAFDEFTRVERIYRKNLGQDLPSVHDIERNVSLIFSNNHFSLHFPRPVFPYYIEMAGIHCRDAQALPQVSKYKVYIIFIQLIET